ncbi:MAG: hypothetical protein KDB14_33390 [Planctomycetales bacterium]|nr:hypothetical protein [Planctomycetales bacterium]
MPAKKPFNPFYPLLVVIGVVFCITACGYGVMTVRKLRNPYEQEPPSMIAWFDEHGFSAMLIELAALGGATFSAMATDGYWARRAEDHKGNDNDPLGADQSKNTGQAAHVHQATEVEPGPQLRN